MKWKTLVQSKMPTRPCVDKDAQQAFGYFVPFVVKID